jgi:WhiB family redox-sensing transcriptional regulator
MSPNQRTIYFGNVYELFPGVMDANMQRNSPKPLTVAEAAELELAKVQSRPHYDPDNWRTGGKCVGVDVNIFIRQDSRSISIAKGICRDCVVREVCLKDAIDNNVPGTRGFYSENERKNLGI